MKFVKFGIWIALFLMPVLEASGYVFIEKDFIQQHDIDNVTKSLRSENPIDFWESMTTNNQAYQEFLKACHKNEKTEKRISAWKDRLPKFDVRDNTFVLTNRDDLCNRIFPRAGLNDSITCCIVNDPSFNSFSIYSPKGSVVALSSGFVDAPGMTDEMIIGMVAHEYAHIYLEHMLQNYFLRAKVEGFNLSSAVFWGVHFGGILGGAIGGAIEGASKGYAMDMGIPKGGDLKGYNMKYYREMVLEADLIAYRFMEWSGIGGEHYIKLLRLIGANDPEGYLGDKNSYYTCHQERLRFINYVKAHPELGNTINEKNLKKQKGREK